ncbi:hypothetical protein LguiA_017893 [Lonicera macranthoides]
MKENQGRFWFTTIFLFLEANHPDQAFRNDLDPLQEIISIRSLLSYNMLREYYISFIYSTL